MSTNLACFAIVNGKRTPATIDLIQTPTNTTYKILKFRDTKRIAEGYLNWVRDTLRSDRITKEEQDKLLCVLENPDSFEFAPA